MKTVWVPGAEKGEDERPWCWGEVPGEKPLMRAGLLEEEEARGGITRFRFFCYVAVGAFFWFFLPGELIPAACRARTAADGQRQATCSKRCPSSRGCAGLLLTIS